MIKFFRKIRHNLLSEGKTGSYLKYALGEIFLVVLGILIALQIDNWNEDRKETDEISKTILNLKAEFQNNYATLNADMHRLKKAANACKVLLNEISSQESNLSMTSVDSLLVFTTGVFTWNPSNYVLNSLKNSDKLELIQDDSLKILLYNYEQYYDDILEWHRTSERATIEFNTYIKTYGSTRNIDYVLSKIVVFSSSHSPSPFKFDNRQLLRNRVVENHLDDIFVSFSFTLMSYKTMLKKIEAIIEETNKYDQSI